MKLLEYRLHDELREYPALYHYQIDPFEAACRLSCEYFIKHGVTYRAVSSAYDLNQYSVIYCETEGVDHHFEDEKPYESLTLEIRKFITRSHAPLMHTVVLESHDEALWYLQSDFIYVPIEGQPGSFDEYKLWATELDEDRTAYVYYGKPTGTVLRR